MWLTTSPSTNPMLAICNILLAMICSCNLQHVRVWDTGHELLKVNKTRNCPNQISQTSLWHQEEAIQDNRCTQTTHKAKLSSLSFSLSQNLSLYEIIAKIERTRRTTSQILDLAQNSHTHRKLYQTKNEQQQHTPLGLDSSHCHYGAWNILLSKPSALILAFIFSWQRGFLIYYHRETFIDK